MNSASAFPSYDHIEDELTSCGLEVDPSFYHGAFCGFFCVKPNAQIEQWLVEGVPYLNDEQEAAPVPTKFIERVGMPQSSVAQLHQITLESLSGTGFDVQLLLLEDEEQLSWRTETLAAWCEGFLLGLTVAGLTNIEELSSDLSEVLRDFVEISRVEHDDEVGDGEEEESAYFEVLEYVRMGVVAFWSELHRRQSEKPSDMPLH